MKLKKLMLPIIILVVAVISMTAFVIVNGISKKPTITEEKFPFSITYELNGKTETIEDVYEASFVGHGGYADPKFRIYEGKIAGMQYEGDTAYVLSESSEGRIVLVTNFYADYMMGDPQYDYFVWETFAPMMLYYDSQEVEYTDEETLLSKGVKLISWEYPQPVENNLVFSHIAILSSEVVLPTVFIGALALLAMIILVKKGKSSKKAKNGKSDKISVVLNFIIGIVVIPFMTVFGAFLDIIGNSAELGQQLLYIIPAFSLLCLAASVGLRRKGFKKGGLAIQFVGPVLFAVVLVSGFLV